MKVGELKKELAKLSDDVEVHFLMYSGCCGETETLTLSPGFELETYEDTTLIFYFDSLPGYKSCIQAGGTLRAHEEYWKNK